MNSQIARPIWLLNGQIMDERPNGKTYLAIQQLNSACYLAVYGLGQKNSLTMMGSVTTLLYFLSLSGRFFLAQPMNSKIAKAIWLLNSQIVHAICLSVQD